MEELRLGIYEYYKGKKYLVIGLAAPESDHSGRLVVYVPLYEAPGPRMWVRPIGEFLEMVTKPDGTTRPRFAYIGQELPGELD